MFLTISFLFLFLGFFIMSWALFMILRPKFSFREVVRINAVARSINKFLFSGAGFVSSGYLAGKDKTDSALLISSFLIVEICSVVYWVAVGAFAGFEFSLSSKIFFLAALAVIFTGYILLRKKIKDRFNAVYTALHQLAGAVPFSLLAGLALFAADIGYYYGVFGFCRIDEISFFRFIMISGLSFVIGYFSPSPAGLGFKDGGMVALLVSYGVPMDKAVWIALVDRAAKMIFFALLGIIWGYKMLISRLKGSRTGLK